MKKLPAKPMKNARGFSLVEILVAAAIVTISIVSTVAFVRKAEELSVIDRHRRAAHGILQRTLESGEYLPSNYNNLHDTVKVTTNVSIDTTLRLSGTLRDSVSGEITEIFNTITLQYRKVVATISWEEKYFLTPMSVSSEKWIAP